MAEWKDLCLSEDVEKLILGRIQSSGLSLCMLRGVQSELISRPDIGTGFVRAAAMEFIKKSGTWPA